MKKLIVAAAILMFGGYSYYTDAHLSPSEKINLAYPLSNNLQLTEEKFRLSLGQDVDAPETFITKYAAAKQLRALSCSIGVNVGRFDSVKSVKSMPIDKDCLKNEDDKLIDFIGLYQLSLEFSKPNIKITFDSSKPMSLVTDKVSYIGGDLSYQAGVGVFYSYNGDFSTFELETGKQIASMPNMRDGNFKGLAISPNGRITAVSSSGGDLRFIHSETGDYIYIAKGISNLYAWLPELNAILVSTKDGSPKIIDLDAGKIVDYNSLVGRLKWVLVDKANPARIILGSYNGFSTVTHKRTATGIETELIDEYLIGNGSLVNRGDLRIGTQRPTLMLGGNAILFVTNKNRLMLYSLKDRTSNELESEALLPKPVPIKLNEHQVVLLMSNYVNSKINYKHVLLDLNDLSIHSAITLDGLAGRGVTGFRDESGFFAGGVSNALFGKEISSSPIGFFGALAAKRKIDEMEASQLARKRFEEYKAQKELIYNQGTKGKKSAKESNLGYIRDGNSYSDVGVAKPKSPPSIPAQKTIEQHRMDIMRGIIQRNGPLPHSR